MKKIGLLLTAFLFASLNIISQNVQLHYDFGKNRKMFTSTVEMFKLDRLGSTFFFIDMDYGSKESQVDGMNLAYWEIARSFKVSKKSKFEPRIEYNGGFGRGQYQDENDSTIQYNYVINNAYLVGLQYSWNSKDFTRIFTLAANYKYIQGKNKASFQLTAIWTLNFFKQKFSMTGFADFWREDNSFGDNSTNYVFLTEPQFWYNACKHFSVGSEIEMSVNFANNEGFMINPTLGVKWTF